MIRGIALQLCNALCFPFMKEIGCDFLGVHFRFMSPKYADLMRENDVIPGPWPIDTDEDMEIIAALSRHVMAGFFSFIILSLAGDMMEIDVLGSIDCMI